MRTVKTDVIIPSYHPGEEFGRLLERLNAQKYPINKIIIMNTEEKFWKKEWENKYPLVEVHHLSKEEFDHGATRRKGAELSDAELLVFMTQDALPADRNLIGNLVSALQNNENAGAAYARQLPKEDCRFLEKYTRSFNYPEKSCVKTEKDVETRGIKTYFCSNVCAAYDHSVYEKVGGFPEKAIFNEDMIYAGWMAKKGYAIVYAADARVYHSHNYTCMQQFHRNFDLAVSQKQHSEIFEQVSSEAEGMKLVKSTIAYLFKIRKPWLIFHFGMQCVGKYAGFWMGRHYEKLSRKQILKYTMNPGYWDMREDVHE